MYLHLGVNIQAAHFMLFAPDAKGQTTLPIQYLQYLHPGEISLETRCYLHPETTLFETRQIKFGCLFSNGNSIGCVSWLTANLIRSILINSKYLSHSYS